MSCPVCHGDHEPECLRVIYARDVDEARIAGARAALEAAKGKHWKFLGRPVVSYEDIDALLDDLETETEETK